MIISHNKKKNLSVSECLQTCSARENIKDHDFCVFINNGCQNTFNIEKWNFGIFIYMKNRVSHSTSK